jgi:hypothetical protein
MGLVDRAVSAGLRKGLRQGLIEGSRVWLGVGAVALAWRIVQRAAGPGKPIVVSETLAPGETLVIKHLSPPD